MRTARSKQASFLASYFCNTTRRDRLKTTRFLENNGHARRDRHRTTDGRFLLIPRCRDRDPGGPPGSETGELFYTCSLLNKIIGHVEVDVFVKLRCDTGVISGTRCRDCIKEFVVIGTSIAIVSICHAAPLVPREHLKLVQRSEVFDGIAANLCRSPVVGPEDPKGRGVDVTPAKRAPRLATGEELARPQVLWVLQHLTSKNLRINAHPPGFDAAPILSDPVIKTLP